MSDQPVTPASDPAQPLTVFVVDDDDDVRQALSFSLRRRGYLVEAYDSAQAFLDGHDPARLGCLVLDYGMPGMNGLELQARLNRHETPVPIVFISGHGAVPQAVQAIKGGAVDFLEKPFRQSVLVERIETAFAQLRDRLASHEAVLRSQEKFQALTSREREIVQRMIGNPAEISSKNIALQLNISPRTVDHHRARILEKTGVTSVAELLALAHRLGWS